MKKTLLLSLLTLTVAVTFAQTPVPFQQAQNTFGALNTLVQALTSGLVKNIGYMLMGVAVVTFLIGLIRFLWAAKSGSEVKISEGKRFMVWGIIGMFVMFSMYGLVRFMQATLGITENSSVDLPNLNLRPNQTAGSFTGQASAPRTVAPGGQVGTGASASNGGAVTVGGVPVCNQSKVGQTCQGAGGTCVYSRTEMVYACISGLPVGTQSVQSARAIAVQQSNGGGTVSGNVAIRIGNATINVKGGTTFAQISSFFNGQTSGQGTSGATGGASGGSSASSGAGVETCMVYCNTPGTSCVKGVCLASAGPSGQAGCLNDYGPGYTYDTNTGTCVASTQSSGTASGGSSQAPAAQTSWFDNPLGNNTGVETCVLWCVNGGSCVNGMCTQGASAQTSQDTGPVQDSGATNQNAAGGDSAFVDPISEYYQGVGTAGE